MSVLRSRIINHAGLGQGNPAAHPYGTEATPMTMPLASVEYGSDQVALYGTLHPIYSGDEGSVAASSQSYIHRPYPAPVAPAGRP